MTEKRTRPRFHSLRAGFPEDVLFELDVREPTVADLRAALANAFERIATLEAWISRLARQVEGTEVSL